ncbi:hypothetical protein R6Q59_005739 [Mikania micrantha]
MDPATTIDDSSDPATTITPPLQLHHHNRATTAAPPSTTPSIQPSPSATEDGTRPRGGARGSEGRRGRQLESGVHGGARRWCSTMGSGGMADGKMFKPNALNWFIT